MFEFSVRGRLVLGQKDAVPWGPLVIAVPAYQNQVVQVVPGTEDTLAVPDILHQVTEVALLG